MAEVLKEELEIKIFTKGNSTGKVVGTEDGLKRKYNSGDLSGLWYHHFLQQGIKREADRGRERVKFEHVEGKESGTH